jgi:phosphoribosyl-ATP pyrophosphohydrolase
MIVPSIDMMGGQTVQLVGGEKKALEAGDPRPLARRFRVAGEVCVIDLDRALGSGSNAEHIRELLAIAPCRVGGGIRDVATAVDWLDRGAAKIILGTAARPEVLRELPRERVICALDARDGEVVVEGWRKATGATIEARMRELKGLAGGFLVTFVEREGRMQGIDLERVRAVVDAAEGAKVTVAGGVTTLEELAAIDAMGADAQVGMALYTGKIHLADGIVASMRSDRPDGLWPTVVTDEQGLALGLAYSDAESVRAAVDQGVGAYRSRKRGLWIKGLTSGATQELLRIDLDCDRDCLRFVVGQREPGFCHLGTRNCWGVDGGLAALARKLERRAREAPAGSYTRRLLDEPELLRAKLIEEARELAKARSIGEVRAETADLIYFALVAMVRGGVDLSAVERELEGRSLRVTRRPGNAKPGDIEQGPST